MPLRHDAASRQSFTQKPSNPIPIACVLCGTHRPRIASMTCNLHSVPLAATPALPPPTRRSARPCSNETLLRSRSPPAPHSYRWLAFESDSTQPHTGTSPLPLAPIDVPCNTPTLARARWPHTYHPSPPPELTPPHTERAPAEVPPDPGPPRTGPQLQDQYTQI
ncbi:unnamed protein product [Lota lota]